MKRALLSSIFAALVVLITTASVSAVSQSAAPTAPGDCPPDTITNILYQTGFESGADGWTSGGLRDSWAIAGSNAHGGSLHYHANDPTQISDQRLVSPPITLPSGQNPVTFQFWHVPALEANGPGACFDGGILEVSVNDGVNWVQVPQLSLLAGQYHGVVSNGYANPLGGLNAWCGTTGYMNTIADVSQFAGQTVRFALRLGSDTSAGDTGWDVDDVTVQSCQPANIDVSPLSMSSMQAANTTTNQTLTVANTGGGTLNWQIAEEPVALPENAGQRVPAQPAATCDNPADVSWLSLSPASGSNAGGANTPVTVAIDSTGLPAGIYTANLCVTSNDPDPGPDNGAGLVVVPVQMMVDQSCISGTVYAYDTSQPMPGAHVQVCSATDSCNVAETDASGQYAVCGLDAGEYDILAFPAPNRNVLPATLGPVTLPASTVVGDQDLILVAPAAPPAGTTITNIGIASSGLPVVYWASDLTLTTHGCTAGTASYEVDHDGGIVRSGTMAEGPDGVYTAVIPQLQPVHGYATITITLTCPGGGVTTISFGMYIDPSGHVLTTGGVPIGGATVTLYRSDASGGPFAPVPNGSGLMAPENRTNPDTTDAAGRFGWNVLAGYYVVRAEAAGCYAPGNPDQAYVESPVLPVPPPVTDLDLRLECPALGVTLADFAAYPGDNEIVIDWETVSELDLQGFDLWRGTSPDGPTERLNETMIPAQAPGSSQGASYRYDDTDVEIGQTYWYWLDDIDLNGVPTRHGPVSATLNPPTAVSLASLDASPACARTFSVAVIASLGGLLVLTLWLRKK